MHVPNCKHDTYDIGFLCLAQTSVRIVDLVQVFSGGFGDLRVVEPGGLLVGSWRLGAHFFGVHWIETGGCRGSEVVCDKDAKEEEQGKSQKASWRKSCAESSYPVRLGSDHLGVVNAVRGLSNPCQ